MYKLPARLLPVLIVLLFGSGLTSCMPVAPTPDMAALQAEYDRVLGLYNQLEIGKSYDQATALLGTPHKFETPEGQSPAGTTVPQFPGLVWEFNDGQTRISYIVNSDTGTGFKIFAWNGWIQTINKEDISTPSQYDAVKLGMPYDQVKEIMGSPGSMVFSHDDHLPGVPKITVSGQKISSTATSRDRTSQVYYWWVEGKSAYDGAMNIMFTDGLVTSKAYAGKTEA
jgi:hypothetical protein